MEVEEEDPGEEEIEGEEVEGQKLWKESPALHGDSSPPSESDIEITG